MLALNSALLLALAVYLEKKFKRRAPPQPDEQSLRLVSRLFTRGPAYCLAGIVFMIPFTAYWYGRNEVKSPATWTLTQPKEAPAYQPAFINSLTTKMLRYTEGWSAKWQTDNNRPFHGFYLQWDKGKSPPDNMNVHTPGGCLINLGIELVKEHPPVELNLQGHTMPVRFLQFRDHGRPLVHGLLRGGKQGLRRSRRCGIIRFLYLKRLRSVIAGRRNPGQRLIEIGLWDEVDQTTALGHLTKFLEQHIVWSSQ